MLIVVLLFLPRSARPFELLVRGEVAGAVLFLSHLALGLLTKAFLCFASKKVVLFVAIVTIMITVLILIVEIVVGTASLIAEMR